MKDSLLARLIRVWRGGLPVRQLVDVFPVGAEVGVVVTILLADLADVDGLRQLRVEIFPLRVQNVGGDLAVGSQPVIVTRISWKLSHLENQ